MSYLKHYNYGRTNRMKVISKKSLSFDIRKLEMICSEIKIFTDIISSAYDSLC